MYDILYIKVILSPQRYINFVSEYHFYLKKRHKKKGEIKRFSLFKWDV